MSPPNLFAAAYAALMLCDPTEKVQAAQALRAGFLAGEYTLQDVVPTQALPIPGRPQKPELVSPLQVPRRKLTTDKGRAALIHAVTHIEFNAINLALDAVYRFRDRPAEYYADWLQVATEEALHFSLLRQRLQDLGFDYGDFAAHNGLWEMAVKTDHDVLKRMALVPRVLEARGLDVTPGMMQRLQDIGDGETVAILDIILRDEIGHVAIGTRWFRHACAERNLEPQSTFRDLLTQYMAGRLKGPFHEAARLQAGFTKQEMQELLDLEKTLNQA